MGFEIDVFNTDTYEFSFEDQEDGTLKVCLVDATWRILPQEDVSKIWEQFNGDKTFKTDQEATDALYYEFRSLVEDAWSKKQAKLAARVTEKHMQLLRDMWKKGELYSIGGRSEKSYWYRDSAQLGEKPKPSRKVPKHIPELLLKLYWIEKDDHHWDNREWVSILFGLEKTFYIQTSEDPPDGLEE